MKRLITAIMATAAFAAMAGSALAQADAQQAYQQATTAFEAGKFDETCELAEKAAGTAPENPEVYLLLGKAWYLRGRLKEAMAGALSPALLASWSGWRSTRFARPRFTLNPAPTKAMRC